MSRIDGGTKDIPTAGTRVQISTKATRVHIIWFTAESGNTGDVWIAFNAVAANAGYPLAPDGTANRETALKLDFGDRSIALNNIYLDTDTDGNDVHWLALID